MGELFGLGLLAKSRCGKWNNILWSSLDVNSNSFWAALNLSHNQLPLKILAEWNLGKFGSKLISVDEDVLNVFLVVD